MTFYVKSGGSNVAKNDIRKRLSGAWASAGVAFKRASAAWVNFISGVQLTNLTISLTGATPTVTQGASFASSGFITDSALSNVYQWLLAGSPTSYQVRWTPISGSLDISSSPVNTWIDLGLAGAPTWSVSISSPATGTVTAQGTAQIRDKTTGTILATGVITLNATR